jgi:hypothetical protein
MIWNKNNYRTKLRKPVPNAFHYSKLRNWNWISGYLGKKANSGDTHYRIIWSIRPPKCQKIPILRIL